MSLKVGALCPECLKWDMREYHEGVFDEMFFDEPRFPGATVHQCPFCDEVVSLGAWIRVRAEDGRVSVPIMMRADEYEMYFKVISLTEGKFRAYNVERFAEVMEGFIKYGSLPEDYRTDLQ